MHCLKTIIEIKLFLRKLKKNPLPIKIESTFGLIRNQYHFKCFRRKLKIKYDFICEYRFGVFGIFFYISFYII